MRRPLLAVILTILACAAMAQAPATRVLLVGGPLIEPLPEKLARVAAATGRSVKAEAAPAFDVDAMKGKWDIVVLQAEAPSPDQRKRFQGDAKRFADAVHGAGAKAALFMSWPRADHVALFRETIAEHREAAQATGAILVPAAEAWLRALGEDPKIKLYAGEGTQAARLGEDLAVLTLFFALFPAGPQEFDEAYLAKIARALQTPPATRDLLVDSATRAIDEPMPLAAKRSP
jgi:hypothetical protein